MKRALRLSLAIVLASFLTTATATGANAQSDAQGDTQTAAQQRDAQETQIGEQFYQQLRQKGEIIAQSPYYATLTPIAKQIKRVADRQYYKPFTFILVHEAQPNAFAVPGGNVYVTDSLMKFVKSREELAGVLCHETSHDIHHDVLNENAKLQGSRNTAGIISVLGSLVLGNSVGGQVLQTINGLEYTTHAAKFSRAVETAADLKGSETCAQAGSNPWGMVWLFTRFEQAQQSGTPEFISDHPSDDHRIAALEDHFAADPSLFARWSKNVAYAHPLR